MESSDRRWTVSRASPVRADAEGLFVPVDDLAHAVVGDGVTVSGPDGNDVRTGVIAELTEAPSGRFFRLELDD
jgi:hypothetical protein